MAFLLEKEAFVILANVATCNSGRAALFNRMFRSGVTSLVKAVQAYTKHFIRKIIFTLLCLLIFMHRHTSAVCQLTKTQQLLPWPIVA